MCGIAAIWDWSSGDVVFRQLNAMAAAQVHRGPDGHGYAVWHHGRAQPGPLVWRGPNSAMPEMGPEPLRVGLAHNWLAIQDRSVVARQPLTTATQRHWISFSGEIYNFVELRERLVAEGVVFRTQSDTEVLLALWERLGPAALSQLRGMFAFVLYDGEADVMWAARDRFGIKPLYYAVLPGNRGVVLSSELRGVHASCLVPRKWNEAAVEAFLAAGVNKPGDETTFFDGVRELPPGCLLEIRPRTVVTRRYYEYRRAAPPNAGAEMLPELRRLFVEVVRLHLRSAREVGTCMSGGLDSTNIASAIRRVLGDEGDRFKAFTLGSRGQGDFELARLAAKTLGFRHHTVRPARLVDPADLVDMIVACETPNHTWGPINQYVLLRHIRSKHKLHVLLDGQGGDEVLSGYAWFYPVLEKTIRSACGPEAAAQLRTAHLGKAPFPEPQLRTFHETFFSRRKWIEQMEGGALRTLGQSVEAVLELQPVQYYLNDELDWDGFLRQELFCRELQLLLRQEDRLAMWFGIESRVPFLDHVLVEWLGCLSPDFLLHDGYLKFPLRVLFPELPAAVRFNVVKRGFWEEYSALPYFSQMACGMVERSDTVAKWMRSGRGMDGASPWVLWRFFQIAVLSAVSSREEAAALGNDLRRSKPYQAALVGRWMKGVWGTGRSIIRRFR